MVRIQNDVLRKKKIAYQAVLASPDGQVMMEDLKMYYGGSTLGKTPDESHHKAGSREVLLHIERMARSEKDALDG